MDSLTAAAFIDKWKDAKLTERQAYQAHFIDLCHLLDEPAPYEDDLDRDDYCFEKSTVKIKKERGWADVWKRGCFAWEYKGPNKNLDNAYEQLQQYAVALEHPPLLIASDFQRIQIHTNWTNTVHQRHDVGLSDLRDYEHRKLLKSAFQEPERLKPGKTRQVVTERAARDLAELAHQLRARGHSPHDVAHFINRLIFCMFAEGVELLRDKRFSAMLRSSLNRPSEFPSLANMLFTAMRDGGYVGFDRIDWFNGGLFDESPALPLEKSEIAMVLEAAKLEWGDVDPAIMGTLFERGLDPDKRSQLGAHYTDREKIDLIIGPVIRKPLLDEWAQEKTQIERDMAKAEQMKAPAAKTKHLKAATSRHAAFIERLRNLRVLDPACGPGNFLYMALLTLKDVEHKANLDMDAMGFQRPFPTIGPECIRGIEVNPYAAELARVSVWMGEIQWMLRNGFAPTKDPVLKPLKTIECRDALLDAEGNPANWPVADFIVGNPPFLGDKKMIGVLGEQYTQQLRKAYAGRVPGSADLVTYWFSKAADAMQSGNAKRAGLVATNSIRGGASRKVLERLLAETTIYNAWGDEPWMIDGAAVRVSIACFAGKNDAAALEQFLDGSPVDAIYADLTGNRVEETVAPSGLPGVGHNKSPAVFVKRVDLTLARTLVENRNVAFMGDTKGGAFDIPGDLARQWLTLPKNPNGQPNSDVLKPWVNGMDLVRRPADKWIIDFGWTMAESDAAFYEAPFQYAVDHIKSERVSRQQKGYAQRWWQHERPRQDMWGTLANLPRYVVTSRVAKHRLFVWKPVSVLPDSATIVVARDDDTSFGILHSRFHELWSLRLCSYLGMGNDPRYTPSTTFETFPFPDQLIPNRPSGGYVNHPGAKAVAAAAKALTDARESWLNPADLVSRVPEVVSGYPDRVIPINAKAAAKLKARTLTSLYNERPAWLNNLHKQLDEAVAAAYGWSADISDDEVLCRLLDLNQQRAA